MKLASVIKSLWPLRWSRRLDLLVFASLAVGVSTASALDFQIHDFESEFDGMPRRQQYFQNDAQTRVLIDLPNNWNNVGEANALTMTQTKLIGCAIRLEKSTLSPQVLFQDKGLDTYRQAALAAVPPGSSNARIVDSTPDAFPMHDWKTYEFVVRYEFFGQAYQRSVLFVNLNAREQMTVSVVAPAELYKRVHTEATELLRTWQQVPIKQGS